MFKDVDLPKKKEVGKIDLQRLIFNEVDDSQIPLQFFFIYDISDKEKQDFISDVEVPLSPEKKCTNIEIVLNMYSDTDWKLETVISFEGGDQEWVDMQEVFSDATEYIEIIRNGKTQKSEEAYANYEYVQNYCEGLKGMACHRN